jgi:hypothetical protein
MTSHVSFSHSFAVRLASFRPDSRKIADGRLQTQPAGREGQLTGIALIRRGPAALIWIN